MKASERLEFLAEPFAEPVPFGRYYLLGRIASGGMGEIFLAKIAGAGSLEKFLVIKRIRPSLEASEQFLAKFMDEARLSITLCHGNIVPVFDAGEMDGTYYIAMEYIEGKDLGQILRRCALSSRPFPVDLALYVMIEALKGLAYAHRKAGPDGRGLNIIHRDVSPANVMVSHEGDIKLLDFGIAKGAITFSRTLTGFVFGKCGYMSPEQLRGEEIDARTDIFCAGIVLWEAVTGRALFQGGAEGEVIERVLAGEVTPPSALVPDISPAEDALFLKALAPCREDRYPRAEDFQLACIQALYGTRASRVTATDLATFVCSLFGEAIRQEGQVLQTLPPVPALPSMALTPPSPSRARAARPWRGRTLVVLALALVVGAASSVVAYLQRSQAPKASVPILVPLLPNLGDLWITSTPEGADVIFDGRVLVHGTPIFLRGLTGASTHWVELRRAGYRSKGMKALIRAGEIFTLHVVLEESPRLVSVYSEPEGATVVVQGEERGTTPAHLSLGPEAFPLRLQVKKKGYLTEEREVLEKEAQEVEVSLRPRPHRAKRPSQTVLIISHPSQAKVLVDGMARGITPLALQDLTPGKSYDLRVEKEGFDPHQTTVDPGKLDKGEISVSLTKATPSFGYLTIDSRPKGRVLVDDKPVGITPLTKVPLPVGTHKVSLEALRTGHRKVLNLTISKGKVTVKKVLLRGRTLW